MAERRILATLPNYAIAEMMAVTLRQLGLRVMVMVGDLDGPNRLMPADLWIEDDSPLENPDTAAEVESLLAGFVNAG